MIAEARAEIRSMIAEEWAECPVAFGHEAFDPPDPPAPWLLVERDIIPSSTSSVYGSEGKRVKQDPGLIAGTIYFPAYVGDDDAYAMAERFGLLFNVKKIGCVQTGTFSLGPAVEADQEGIWTMISVTIPFTISYLA